MDRGVTEETMVTPIMVIMVTRASPWWGSVQCCYPVVSTQLTSHPSIIRRSGGTRVHCPSSLSSPAMTLQEVTTVQIGSKCINQVHIKLYKHFLLWYHSHGAQSVSNKIHSNSSLKQKWIYLRSDKGEQVFNAKIICMCKNWSDPTTIMPHIAKNLHRGAVSS